MGGPSIFATHPASPRRHSLIPCRVRQQPHVWDVTVLENPSPVTKLQIRSDNEAASGVPVGQQDEEQLGLVGIEADEAQLVADQKVEAVQLSLQPAQPVLSLSLGELHHQLGHRDEAQPPSL